MTGVFGGIGRFSVRFRWAIIIVWLVGTVFATKALPSLSSQVNNDNSQFLPASAPSNQAFDLAKPLIGSENHANVPVVVVSQHGQFTDADRAALKSLRSDLEKVPTVLSANFIGESPGHNAAQLLVTSSTTPFGPTGPKDLVDHLDAAINRAQLPEGVSAHLAGQLVTDVAVNEKSNKQGNAVQLFSVLFIIVLLLFIFRALLAPLVTLLPAVFALALSGAFIGALGSAGTLKISFFTQILLIVLLLGAGTDYGLFLVFRVREELLDGSDPRVAVERAVRRVGESITASAATVIVALLSLTLATFGIYHDLGIPLAIGIAVMLLAGLTLLPALLAVFGRAVFWPSKTAPREHGDGVWGRIAGRLVRRPALTLGIGVAVLGLLAAFALGFKPGGFGGQINPPAGSDAAKGAAAQARYFPHSNANPTNLIMQFPTSVWENPQQLVSATAALHDSGQFTTLAGPLNPAGTELSPAELTHLHDTLPPAKQLVAENKLTPTDSSIPLALYQSYLATARYISQDGKTVQWESGLRAGTPETTAALQAIPDVRAAVEHAAQQAGATDSGVAGEAAALYDVSHISDGDLRHIVPIAVLAIGLVLALVLRSLIAPIYLILSVVLSYLASLGISVLIFIKFGNSGGIVFLLPFLMFIFLLALGEDYNILVMTRIREEAGRRPLREAVVRAVGTTGPTVTSAGLVLAGTFVVLAVVGGSGPGNSQVRQIGIGLAVGILLDTFVVRTVLVPSTVELLGRWNWWPSALSRKPTARAVAAAAAEATAAVSVSAGEPADGSDGKGARIRDGGDGRGTTSGSADGSADGSPGRAERSGRSEPPDQGRGPRSGDVT
jgi:RND superfamily putative drug exporter